MTINAAIGLGVLVFAFGFVAGYVANKIDRILSGRNG